MSLRLPAFMHSGVFVGWAANVKQVTAGSTLASCAMQALLFITALDSL